jgi:hypothetical protein
MLQIVLKLEEKPNDFPQKISMSMISTIIKPEKYHGQGCLMKSIITLKNFF